MCEILPEVKALLGLIGLYVLYGFPLKVIDETPILCKGFLTMGYLHVLCVNILLAS